MDVDPSSEPSRLFEITVRNRWGRTSTHQVDRSWTVGYLKRVLAVGEDLPPDQQRLVCGGVELQDWRTLADYDLPPDYDQPHPGPRLETIVNLEAMHWSLFGLRVFVVLPSGERFDLDIGSPWTSIWWVKQLIQEKKGIPVSQQRLAWHGLSPCAEDNILEDGHTLADYNIRCDSVLTLTLESE